MAGQTGGRRTLGALRRLMVNVMYMEKKVYLGFLISIILISGCELNQKPEPIFTTPVMCKDLESLQEQIQGQTPIQIYDTIVSFFGKPDRDNGSGLSIPEWDINGGVLVFHPSMGPSFTDKNGSKVWLLNTENEAGENIFGRYEMFTAPFLYGNDARYWMGNLLLRADGTYEFIDSGTNLDKRDYQENNFFVNNPCGRFEIDYPLGITETTLLESLEDHMLIADLEFFEKNEFTGSAFTEQFHVIIEGKTLHLNSIDYDAQTYYLYKAWQNFWNYNSAVNAAGTRQ